MQRQFQWDAIRGSQIAAASAEAFLLNNRFGRLVTDLKNIFDAITTLADTAIDHEERITTLEADMAEVSDNVLRMTNNQQETNELLLALLTEVRAMNEAQGVVIDTSSIVEK